VSYADAYAHLGHPVDLRAKVARLEAALAWYADPANYQRPAGEPFAGNPVDDDGGARARLTLGRT
jgi:hypothetical protein